MKGGYQILDLRCVGLELSNETQNFTNEEVLKQLRNLRDHIEKEHAYAKPLRNGLKAIMIRYRDAKSGELLEMCGFADIISSNESLTYEIIAKDLRIEVVFEEKTDEVGNKYFDIKTAKYLYNKNIIVEGNLIAPVINGEENPSVKPIYCHPVSIYDVSNEDTSKRFFATCLIFNNSPTAFNGNTFLEFVRSLAQTVSGRIMISGGGYKNETGAIIFSSLFYDNSNENFVFEGYRATVGDYSAASFEEWAESVVLIDGVNKIN